MRKFFSRGAFPHTRLSFSLSVFSLPNKIFIVPAYPQRGLPLSQWRNRLVFFGIKTVIRPQAADSSESRVKSHRPIALPVGIATCKLLRSIDYNVTITSSMRPYGDPARNFERSGMNDGFVDAEKTTELAMRIDRVFFIPPFVPIEMRSRTSATKRAHGDAKLITRS